MPRATPSSRKPPSGKTILLIGPPGGGKTTLAMQFPSPGFIDCDGNLDGPDEFVRKYCNSLLEYSYEQVRYKEDKTPVDTAKCFDRLELLITQMGRDPLVKTIVIDSILHINEFIIQKVLAGHTGASSMETRWWDEVKSDYMRLLAGWIRNTGKCCIVTIHEKPIYTTDQKKMMEKVLTGYEPLIQSGIRDGLGGLFTDVWRCYSRAAGQGKYEFVIQPHKDDKSTQLKNTMMFEDKIVIPSNKPAWPLIEKYVKGRLGPGID